jgi:predicted HicB family RNase H-like nuclease
MSQPIIRRTLEIPVDVHESLAAQAAAQQVSMQQLIIRYVREGVARDTQDK